MISDIDSVQEFDEALKNDTAVVDFWASWCTPCLIMAPIFEEVANKKDMKNIKFIKVNVDDYPELAEKFGIMSIPTTVIIKKGKEAGRIIGAQSIEALEEKLKKFI